MHRWIRILGSCLLASLLVILPGCSPAQPTMELEKTVYRPGEEIRVKFAAPSSWPDHAWVGIIPSDIMHGSEERNDQHDLTYYHLKKQREGVLVFFAPHVPGKYDVRMHDSDHKGKEVLSITFEVRN